LNPAGTLVPAPERRSPSIAAFLSFQIRVVAGLRVLAGAA
jgi:hypothetical protein